MSQLLLNKKNRSKNIIYVYKPWKNKIWLNICRNRNLVNFNQIKVIKITKNIKIIKKIRTQKMGCRWLVMLVREYENNKIIKLKSLTITTSQRQPSLTKKKS